MDRRQWLEKIDEIVKAHPVVLFMKGTPEFPQCGFSQRAVAILKSLGVPFVAVNVLVDPDLREAVKEYANWPTYPQLYVHGELVGGSDIMAEMLETGELQEMLAACMPNRASGQD